MLKKVLSYFVPIVVHRQKSALSKSIEVTWANGQLVLDSGNTNYSFGSLQRILRKGLLEIGFDNIRRMEKILILGVAGGSIVKTLTDEIAFKGKITGVEIDPEIIKVAENYFGLRQSEKFQLFVEDAFEFVLRTREVYDLVVIDIFQDTKMPQFLFEKFFLDRLFEIVKPKGSILFNTMILSQADASRNKAWREMVENGKCDLKIIPKIEDHNELLLIRRS